MKLSAETLAKLRILRTANVGPKTFKRLLQRAAAAQEVIADWARMPVKAPLCDEATVLRELEKLHAANGWMCVWGEASFPLQLAELPDSPVVLSGLGEMKWLHEKQVAMVGNRAASAAGMSWSAALAADLARANVVVTSGLARGIDTAAHEGALRANGATIAVVAGGVDHVYPPENAKLREQIMAHGCVVSEQPWGMVPTASLFPRRNRIIAGLSVGVVVSEATRHSGSLITAECALEYGREVWAVPGSPSDARSGGPNWLLKNGATLIENAQDILENLPQRPAPFVPRVQRVGAQPDLFAPPAESEFKDVLADEMNEEPQNERQRLYALLGRVPQHFDTLVRQLALPESDVNLLLVELELDNLVRREADGSWSRC